jgi:hypothetical protein
VDHILSASSDRRLQLCGIYIYRNGVGSPEGCSRDRSQAYPATAENGDHIVCGDTTTGHRVKTHRKRLDKGKMVLRQRRWINFVFGNGEKRC